MNTLNTSLLSKEPPERPTYQRKEYWNQRRNNWSEIKEMKQTFHHERKICREFFHYLATDSSEFSHAFITWFSTRFPSPWLSSVVYGRLWNHRPTQRSLRSRCTTLGFPPQAPFKVISHAYHPMHFGHPMPQNTWAPILGA